MPAWPNSGCWKIMYDVQSDKVMVWKNTVLIASLIHYGAATCWKALPLNICIPASIDCDIITIVFLGPNLFPRSNFPKPLPFSLTLMLKCTCFLVKHVTRWVHYHCLMLHLFLSLSPPLSPCQPRSHLMWRWGVSLSWSPHLHPRGLALWWRARLPWRLGRSWQNL